MTDSTSESPQGTGPENVGDQPSATVSPVAELPTAAAAPPVATPPEAGRSGGGMSSRLPLVIVGALVLVAVVVVLVLTVFSSSGDDETGAYRDKVSTVLAPVISANKQLSTSLAALHGTSSTAAQRKVTTAESATTAARGGLAALTVPKGAAQTAINARQTLTREASYLQAVKVVLADPSGDAAQTQTLAANLTGALDVIAPADQDWSQSVTGSDTLTAWAPKAASTLRARKAAASRKAAAARKRRTAAAHRSTSTSASSGQAPAATSSGGTDCGSGLHAGPSTSCAFAENVRSAWLDAPGAVNTIRVYSPVTGETYTMSCSPAGGGITCSGANNASVTWD
jgi:hypothetical protein